MNTADPKLTLQGYLTEARDAMVWKTEGLTEYDVRRPLTPTGTNLLGLVKHLSIVEAWYFGATFDRPFAETLTWWDDDAPESIDMWATAEESRAEIIDRYRAATAHADATIEALDLTASGHVPWWGTPDTTLHAMLVHVLAETSRHAGHADILREQLDGTAGLRVSTSNLPDLDAPAWRTYVETIEQAAVAASRSNE